MHLLELASGIATSFIVGCIRFYQRFISPFTRASCRFYPSCSEYSLQSINTHGLFIGLMKTIIRLAKCHPFHPGGYDPVR